MKVAVFSAHKFERPYLENANEDRHELVFLDTYLNIETVSVAKGFEAISIFTQDTASAPVLDKLHEFGIKMIALRSAGYNNVDMVRAKKLGLVIARVPEYSPFAIAEFTMAIILALNRKLIKSHYRIMELNFSLDGLVGFDMNGKTVGIVGTGKIGSIVVKILHGFGCKILGNDIRENRELEEKYGLTYTTLESLCEKSDIITLHVPLTPETTHIINVTKLNSMKRGVMLINTGRGALVNTKDIISSLKSGQIGYFGMDVYEEEQGLFFEDHSDDILQDDVIARLMTFKNVMITSHQAFLTETALQNIAKTTLENLDCISTGKRCANEIL